MDYFTSNAHEKTYFKIYEVTFQCKEELEIEPGMLES